VREEGWWRGDERRVDTDLYNNTSWKDIIYLEALSWQAWSKRKILKKDVLESCTLYRIECTSSLARSTKNCQAKIRVHVHVLQKNT